MGTETGPRSDAEWNTWVENAFFLWIFIRCWNSTGVSDEEIFQDTVCAAYYNVINGRYVWQSDASFRSYVIGIARNKIRAAARRRKRHTVFEAEVHPSAMYMPEQAVVSQEAVERLHEVLAVMPSMRAEATSRRLLHHEPYEKIASAMGISAAAARKHVSRGMRDLKKSDLPDWF